MLNNDNFYKGDIDRLEENEIFVFGSNPEGRHGAGAAKIAKEKFGAIYGIGRGIQGQSYALPTKNLKKNYIEKLPNGEKIIYKKYGEKSISLKNIELNIEELFNYIKSNPKKIFKIAYKNNKNNLNGYKTEELINLFKKQLLNFPMIINQIQFSDTVKSFFQKEKKNIDIIINKNKESGDFIIGNGDNINILRKLYHMKKVLNFNINFIIEDFIENKKEIEILKDFFQVKIKENKDEDLTKIAIIGSRDYDSLDDMINVIDKYIEEEKIDINKLRIVSGGARGADKLSVEYLKYKYKGNYKKHLIEFIPDWDKYGKSAGYKRNYEIWAEADLGIAFWDGESKGTAHSFEIVKKQKKELIVINYKNKSQSFKINKDGEKVSLKIKEGVSKINKEKKLIIDVSNYIIRYYHTFMNNVEFKIEKKIKEYINDERKYSFEELKDDFEKILKSQDKLILNSLFKDMFQNQRFSSENIFLCFDYGSFINEIKEIREYLIENNNNGLGYKEQRKKEVENKITDTYEEKIKKEIKKIKRQCNQQLMTDFYNISKKLKIKTLKLKNVEADHFIAITSKYLSNIENEHKVISKDEDFKQLLKSKFVELESPGEYNISYNENTIFEAKIDLEKKIIEGDSSDNIPSIFNFISKKLDLKIQFGKKTIEKELDLVIEKNKNIIYEEDKLLKEITKLLFKRIDGKQLVKIKEIIKENTKQRKEENLQEKNIIISTKLYEAFIKMQENENNEDFKLEYNELLSKYKDQKEYINKILIDNYIDKNKLLKIIKNNYKNNKRIIDFDYIPKEYEEKITEELDKEIEKDEKITVEEIENILIKEGIKKEKIKKNNSKHK